MKSILQLTGSFHNGGSERQAAGLAIGLKNAGEFDVHLATLNHDGVLLDFVRAAGFENVPDFPLTSFYNANFVKQVRACATYLNRNNVELIHTHDFYTNVFGMAAASIAGTRVKIASKRETGGMRSRVQDVVEGISFRRADRIIVNAQAVANVVADRGISASKIDVIYNGLDLENFERHTPDFKAKLGIDPNRRLITLAANLRHDVKDVPMFLSAAKRVADVVSDAHFVIAGEGPLLSSLQSKTRELGIGEQTHFIGRCEDVPSLLASSYACVLTSKAEGFANAIIEYMAAGKPVVATRVGGAAEAVVENETGYLVDSGDAATMADRLVDILNDDEKARAFGEAGRHRAHSLFSREAQLVKTAALYHSLLS